MPNVLSSFFFDIYLQKLYVFMSLLFWINSIVFLAYGCHLAFHIIMHYCKLNAKWKFIGNFLIIETFDLSYFMKIFNIFRLALKFLSFKLLQRGM